MKLSSGAIQPDEMTLFQNYLHEHSGIFIPQEKSYLFETRLSKMMAETGMDSFRDFYGYVKSGAAPGIKQKIIEAMTTNETRWFRDGSPWKVMELFILPKLVEALVTGGLKRARIWFSAVSTGQEAYSTVMCVDNYLKNNPTAGVSLSDFEFLATDISGNVLEIAKKGRYDAISITRGLDDYYRDKYFTKENAAWVLSEKIRDAVKFERFNLQNSYIGLGEFNVIFCRYVLIYFPNELKNKIMAKMYQALTGGGVLFTGIYALYDHYLNGFEIEDYENLTYYKKATGKGEQPGENSDS